MVLSKVVAILSDKVDFIRNEEEKVEKKEVSQNIKYLIMFSYGIAILLSAFIFNTPMEIFEGMKIILVEPSILVTDYFYVANIGAALFNSGILMIFATIIVKYNKININGPIIAAIFTIGGFALFGKTLYNILSIMFGVFLYAKVKQEPFSKFILMALFGTALGPLVSQVSFGYGLGTIEGIIFGNILGILAGFIIPPLASHFVRFHQGFNLYNLGFTAGIVGTIIIAILRSLGLEHDSVHMVSSGNNFIMGFYLLLFFTSLILIGAIYCNNKLVELYKLIKQPGQLVTDFVALNGLGPSFINMGIIGALSTGYVLLVGGELNGPIIGGIFTIVGFGSFGKHFKNIIPIFIGIYIASIFNIWEVNSTGALLGALFGTTLAPISGRFGWKYGVLAGFCHMAMVMNVGYLHGGVNLYNNGFSGGFVAAILVPIITSLKKEVI